MTITNNQRISLLHNLGLWMNNNDPTWLQVQERALQANPWFTMEHIAYALNSIQTQFLSQEKLTTWLENYAPVSQPKNVGIVMAGNIPMVGFHDFICGFLSGNNLKIKLSSKDEILFTFLLRLLGEWEPEVLEQVNIQERLNGCDAYIATGSNNTARYFEAYFGKYPNIIRKNKTSVAVLDGNETDDELLKLADDVYLYYGLGCRSVTQLCVPEGYNFENLLHLFNKYDHYSDLNKYKNNYDYHLALYLLNRVTYMSNSSLLMVENVIPFSAVSVLHYRYYTHKDELLDELTMNIDIQTIVGKGFTPFGTSQQPTLIDYADGIDTMAFLCTL